jgi:signal transduction histidine kinase
MTTGVDGLGWAVAGLLLLVTGTGLARRPGARTAGVLFALAGALLVVVGAVPLADAGPVGVAAMAVLAAAATSYPRFVVDVPGCAALAAALFGAPALAVVLAADGRIGVVDLVWVASGLVVVVAGLVWWRLETAGPEVRSPLLWVLSTAAVTLFLLGVATVADAFGVLATVVHAGIGLVGVAALLGDDRERALDGRWLASRSAAWFFTGACTFAVATLVLTLLAWRSGTRPGPVTTSVVAVVCGVLWGPLLVVVQKVSDGLLFGFRPDAMTAAQRVAISVGDDPTAAVRAIQEALVLPYAALELAGEDLVEVGGPPPRRRVFPIDLDGEHVGNLVVGVRPGDRTLSKDDARVLTLALPLLVQTIRERALVGDLQRARAASAAAREEERRRLRRDLHDGLGPRLTGIAFTADAARLATTEPAVAPMLDRIRSEAETALDEVREMAYGLRPPALDELGLVGAVRLRTGTLDGLRVDIEPTALPPLPAAVEVAAYRIVTEALTNVVRHSGASRAAVLLRLEEDHLRVEVADDGRAGGAWVPGVGLTSMRERAAELDGTVSWRGTPDGSTVVALLPCGPVPTPAGPGHPPVPG